MVQRILQDVKIIEIQNYVTDLVCDNICNFSKHKYASCVVEKCLKFVNLENQCKLIGSFIKGEKGLLCSRLACHKFGNYGIL